MIRISAGRSQWNAPTIVYDLAVIIPEIDNPRRIFEDQGGRLYIQVGKHEFAQKAEARFIYTFDSIEARYVRLSYPDNHTASVNYPNTFMFTTEVEVYAPGKGLAVK